MMKNYKTAFDNLFKEINQVVVGQDDVIKQVLICILCDSNALLDLGTRIDHPLTGAVYGVQFLQRNCA